MKMEGEIYSSTSGKNNEQDSSSSSNIKKGCLSFVASIQESLGYVKAFVVGKGKMLMARNEKEATAAELETAKMQVEAADAAEDKKRRLQQNN